MNVALQTILDNPDCRAAIAEGMEFTQIVKLAEGESITGVYTGPLAGTVEDTITGDPKPVTYHLFRVQPGLIAQLLGGAQLDRKFTPEGMEKPVGIGVKFTLLRGPKTKIDGGAREVSNYFIGEAKK